MFKRLKAAYWAAVPARSRTAALARDFRNSRENSTCFLLDEAPKRHAPTHWCNLDGELKLPLETRKKSHGFPKRDHDFHSALAEGTNSVSALISFRQNRRTC
jgi:hypothetical protein